MRARIGYSFGAVRDARADRGARDVASRVDPRPLRTPPKLKNFKFPLIRK